MSDRLQELIQQRRLIEEHLAWLNREIAATPSPPAGGFVSDSRARPARTPGASATPLVLRPQAETYVQTSIAEKDADTILAEFQQNPQNLRQDVRRGCLIYFSVVMAIFMLGVFLLYLNYVSRNRPVSPSPSAPTVESP